MRQELTLKTIIFFLNGKGNPNKLGNQKFSGSQTSQLGTVQQQLMEQWKITHQNLWCMANHNIGSQSSSRKASHEWPDILSEKREYKQYGNNCSGYTWELLPWLERMTGPIKLRTLLLMVIQHGGGTIYLFLFILVLFSTTVFFSVHDTWFHEVQWAIAILCELLGQL